MLSGPRQKFADGIVAGKTASAAYRLAYPKCSGSAARRNASRLLTNADLRTEIARQRAAAEVAAGSSVMTLIEKRMFLARIVRANVVLLPADSDLWQSVERGKRGARLRIADKLVAIKLDNELAGSDSEAEADDALSKMLVRVVIGGENA